MRSEISLETKAAQALGWIDESTHSIIPPLYLSATYQRKEDLSYHKGLKYTRADNPTYQQVGQLLAELENGKATQLFSSGMAATAAILQTLREGDHIILTEGVYAGTKRWVKTYLKNWGIEASFIPDGNLNALEAGLITGRTRIVWIETPSNPFWKITDINEFSVAAHNAGAIVVCDNTVATPVLTRPLDIGADLVLHSATKYLNGHGDILMGALVTKEENELWNRLLAIAHDGGALPGAFEAWMLLRGLRTLYLRMERICSNAQMIAESLENHPRIREVYYPGLWKFPGHTTAVKQMKNGFGGMISVRLGSKESAVRMQARTRLFRRATSLGLTESLIEHRKSYEGRGTKVPDDMIRLSVGIECAEDLKNDLDYALDLV